MTLLVAALKAFCKNGEPGVAERHGGSVCGSVGQDALHHFHGGGLGGDLCIGLGHQFVDPVGVLVSLLPGCCDRHPAL